MTLCPSGQGVGLEIQWALPARVRTPSVSYSFVELENAAAICFVELENAAATVA